MGLPIFPPENIYKKVVLIEKHKGQDRSWMLSWIKEQKVKAILGLNFEEANKWLDVETMFFDVERHNIKVNKEMFDDIFYMLYERF